MRWIIRLLCLLGLIKADDDQCLLQVGKAPCNSLCEDKGSKEFQLGSGIKATVCGSCSIHFSKKGIILLQLDGDFLQVGTGNLDEIAAKVVMEGALANQPEAKNFSLGMTCSSSFVDKSLMVEGRISNFGAEVPYKASFWQYGGHLKFQLGLPQGRAGDFLQFSYKSPREEGIYGLGLQPTIWNFKGTTDVPLIPVDGGIGRGLWPITGIVDSQAKGMGGTNITSYAPAVAYVTNLSRAVVIPTPFVGEANFEADKTRLLYWHSSEIQGQIFGDTSPLELSRLVSQNVGLMKPLPRWIFDGAIVGMEGGQEFVDKTYKFLKERQIPMVGIWMQDWAGSSVTQLGTRVHWNWQLNTSHYSNWTNMVQAWSKDGVRPLVYINPFVANLTGMPGLRQNQFKEGVEKGYFLKNKTGQVSIVKSNDLDAAMPDLSNPEAYTWYKEIICENLVKDVLSAGWMHDFGEGVRLDSVPSDGSDPVKFHNEYARLWSKLADDALASCGDGEIVPWVRSGIVGSSKHVSLYWTGDQLPTGDRLDGMHSAFIAMMNGGLSGFTKCHSDIGGYNSAGIHHAEPPVKYHPGDDPYTGYGMGMGQRTNTTLKKWIEQSTFADAMFRTHPGMQPETAAQVYQNAEMADFFGLFANIHKLLGDYKFQLSEEASNFGTPMQRPLFLHFPKDPRAWEEDSELLLGPSILIAPIFDWQYPLKKTSRDIYLPGPATWIHLWSKKVYKVTAAGKDLKDFAAPLGSPAVFFRDFSGQFDAMGMIEAIHKLK